MTSLLKGYENAADQLREFEVTLTEVITHQDLVENEIGLQHHLPTKLKLIKGTLTSKRLLKNLNRMIISPIMKFKINKTLKL